MGEELFCASAGGGRVGGPETSHGASGGFGNGAGDGLVDSTAASWVARVWVWLVFVGGLRIRGQPFR